MQEERTVLAIQNPAGAAQHLTKGAHFINPTNLCESSFKGKPLHLACFGSLHLGVKAVYKNLAAAHAVAERLQDHEAEQALRSTMNPSFAPLSRALGAVLSEAAGEFMLVAAWQDTLVALPSDTYPLYYALVDDAAAVTSVPDLIALHVGKGPVAKLQNGELFCKAGVHYPYSLTPTRPLHMRVHHASSTVQ